MSDSLVVKKYESILETIKKVKPTEEVIDSYLRGLESKYLEFIHQTIGNESVKSRNHDRIAELAKKKDITEEEQKELTNLQANLSKIEEQQEEREYYITHMQNIIICLRNYKDA